MLLLVKGNSIEVSERYRPLWLDSEDCADSLTREVVSDRDARDRPDSNDCP